MDAVDDTKSGQPLEAAGQIQPCMPHRLQGNGETEEKEDQAINEINEDGITAEKFLQDFVHGESVTQLAAFVQVFSAITNTSHVGPATNVACVLKKVE